MGGLRKTKKNSEDDEDEKVPKFILIDRENRKVWHEQFRSREEAKGKIDYEKSKMIKGNWEIEQI